MSAGDGAGSPRWKSLLFSLVAIVGVLVVVELLLILAGVKPLTERDDPFFGFSEQMRVFETDESAGVVRTRARAVQHSFNAQAFPVDKPDNGLRIFVLGGSSAFGFPWGAAQAFPASLERALEQSLPDRDVQAINAAGMSYGSHRLRILTHEILQYEPDLLVLYTGHNEFVERDFYDRVTAAEPLPGGLRLWLHRWRLYSALKRIVFWEAAPDDGRDTVVPGSDSTVGDVRRRLATGQSDAEDVPDEVSAAELIGLDADRRYATDVAAADREAVRALFEENLRAIVTAAGEVNIPVALSTVPSNVRSWRPNQTTWPGDLSATDRSIAERAIEHATEANDAEDPQEALAAVALVEEVTTAAADAWYEKGRALLALDRIEEAAAAFGAARDHDGQPGRAIDSFNETIRRVAAETGALLVDAERAFVETSGNGIPGFDLFEDYVHPKPGAHVLIAREIWSALLSDGRFGDAPHDETAFLAALELEPGFDYAAAADAPEAEQEQAPDRAAMLFNLGVVLENQQRYEEAMERYRDCLELQPSYHVARVNLARLLRLTGDPSKAAMEYSQVLAVWPDHLNSAIGFGESMRELQLLPQAETAFRRATEIDPRSPGAWNGLGGVYTLMGNYREAELAFRKTLELDPDNLSIRSNLGMAIFFQGRLDDAEAEFSSMLEIRPDDPGAMNGMGAVSVERNRLDDAERWFNRVLAIEPANTLANDGLAEVRRRRAQP